MTKKNVRVSTSFSLEQTVLLDEICTIMLRGGDPKLLRRNHAFGSLCQTAKSLRRRAENPAEPRKKIDLDPVQATHDGRTVTYNEAIDIDAAPLDALHPTHIAELERSQESAALPAEAAVAETPVTS